MATISSHSLIICLLSNAYLMSLAFSQFLIFFFNKKLFQQENIYSPLNRQIYQHQLKTQKQQERRRKTPRKNHVARLETLYNLTIYFLQKFHLRKKLINLQRTRIGQNIFWLDFVVIYVQFQSLMSHVLEVHVFLKYLFIVSSFPQPNSSFIFVGYSSCDQWILITFSFPSF